jgi:endonuclease G
MDIATVPDGVTEVAATAIHIEDLGDWQETVKEAIQEDVKVRFRKFVSSSSIEEVESELRSVSGPLVLFMDLRTEERSSSFAGYRYLLTELGELLHRNASTVVFVISGQLNDGVIEMLRTSGIPETHIYDKGKWPRQLPQFASTVRDAVLNMDDVALNNIARGVSGQNIDPYLMHTLEAQEETASIGETQSETDGQLSIPIIVRTKVDPWNYEGIPDLTVLSHIDNIYSCLGSARTIAALEQDPQVEKVEGSRPGSGAECHTSVPFVGVRTIHEKNAEKGHHALSAFADTGIDVLHEAFLDASGRESRILAIWDQTDETGPPPPGHRVGTEHTHEKINEYIRSGQMPRGLTVEAGDHGTHVASIAAGRATAHFAGGVAPEAHILLVIPAMETLPGKPQSLGYSMSHLMVLQYIRDTAASLNLPVVINISQGMNGGGHDGTSNLEKGVDAIMQNGMAPGVIVVKSAGNERGRAGHAQILMGEQSLEGLRWTSRLPHTGPDVIELWYSASDQYSFRLSDPAGEKSPWVDLKNPAATDYFPFGNRYQINLIKYDGDNGDSRLLITISSGRTKFIAGDQWELEIVSRIIRNGVIHAWMERDNRRPIHFVNHLSDDFTLSVPGTANHVITVGSVKPSLPLELSDFSSFGPTRDGRHKPDLVAPGHEISAANANSTSGIMVQTGTSMAAPHVTGAIALLLSHQVKNGNLPVLNAAQVQSAITQSCRNYKGTWHPGLGFGLLDVETFWRELI